MSTTIAIVLVLLAAGLFAYVKYRQHGHVTTGDAIGLAWLTMAAGLLAIAGIAVGVLT